MTTTGRYTNRVQSNQLQADQLLADQLLVSAWSVLEQQAAGPRFSTLLEEVYGVTAARAESLRQEILSGQVAVPVVVVLSDGAMQGALGAYGSSGHQSKPSIYLNSRLLAEDSRSARAQRVLLEEIGHHLDLLLNGASDTPGDEGELFASRLLNAPLSSGELLAVHGENDAGTVVIAGQAVPVERSTAVPTLSLINYIDTGSSNSDRISTDNAFGLRLSGQQAGSTVVYQSRKDGGTWGNSASSLSGLSNGTYEFRAEVTNAAGVTITSNIITVVVDRTTKVPTLSLTDYEDTGRSSTDRISRDNSFGLAVSGQEDGATVTFQVRRPGGSWTNANQNVADLADGTYEFRALVTDVAGNRASSNVLRVVVDNRTAVSTLSLSSYSDTGSSNSDRISTDNAFTLRLTGQEAGSSVVFQRRQSDGTWTTSAKSLSGLADGTYQFRALVTDVAGNEASSNEITVVVDRSPELPTLTLGNDDGVSSTDRITSDGTILVGNLESGASWEYSLNAGSTWENGSNSSFIAPSGTYASGVIRVRQRDVAGNNATGNLAFALEVQAPLSFAVSEAAGGVSFSGTATGPINVTVDSSGVASFSRAGINALGSVSDLFNKQLEVDPDTTLLVTVTGTASNDQFRIDAPNAAAIVFSGDAGGGSDTFAVKIDDTVAGYNERTLKLDTSGVTGGETLSFIFDASAANTAGTALDNDKVTLTNDSVIANSFSTIVVRVGRVDLSQAQKPANLSYDIQSGVLLSYQDFITADSFLSLNDTGALEILLNDAAQLGSLKTFLTTAPESFTLIGLSVSITLSGGDTYLIHNGVPSKVVMSGSQLSFEAVPNTDPNHAALVDAFTALDGVSYPGIVRLSGQVEALQTQINSLAIADIDGLSDQLDTLTTDIDALKSAGADVTALQAAVGAPASGSTAATGLYLLIETSIAAAISDLENRLKDGVSGDFDTLKEIETALAELDAAIVELQTGAGNQELIDRIAALEAALEQLKIVPLKNWATEFSAANPTDTNPNNSFTVAEIFGSPGANGSSTVLNNFISAFAERIAGYDPATVPLNVDGELTVAQAVALAQAGFAVNSEKLTYSVRAGFTSVQAALADPAGSAALAGASEVVAVGNNAPNTIDMSAFGPSVNLRIEALGGDDTVVMGPGSQDVVGGAGGDTLWLHDQSPASDNVVYTSLYEGKSLPVVSVDFPAAAASEGDFDYYRQGALLSIRVNNTVVSYTVQPGDTPEQAMAALAAAIDAHASLGAITATAEGTTLRVVGEQGQRLNVQPLAADGTEISNPGLTTEVVLTFSGDANVYPTALSEKGTFLFDRTITISINGVDVEAAIAYAAANAGGGVDVAATVKNLETAILAKSNAGEALADAFSSVVADGLKLTLTAKEVPATDADAPTITIDSITVSDVGEQQQTSVTFSSKDADYYAGGKLSITVAGQTITTDMVEGDAAGSVAALRTAVLAAAQSGPASVVLESAGGIPLLDGTNYTVSGFMPSQGGMTIEIYEKGILLPIPEINVSTWIGFPFSSLASLMSGQYKGYVDFSINPNGSLVITTEKTGPDIELRVTPGNFSITANSGPGANYTVDDDAIARSATGTKGIISGLLESVELVDTSLSFTALQETSDPLLAEGRLDFAGEVQRATIDLDLASFYADRLEDGRPAVTREVPVYFEGGKVYATISSTEPGAAPITIGANMAVETATEIPLQDFLVLAKAVDPNATNPDFRERTAQNLVEAINAQTGDGGSLNGLIASAELVDGRIILTAAVNAQQTFEVSDVRLDYLGLKQLATISLDNASVHDTLADGTVINRGGAPVYFEGGKVYATITATEPGAKPVTVMAEMVADQAGEVILHGLASKYVEAAAFTFNLYFKSGHNSISISDNPFSGRDKNTLLDVVSDIQAGLSADGRGFTAELIGEDLILRGLSGVSQVELFSTNDFTSFPFNLDAADIEVKEPISGALATAENLANAINGASMFGDLADLIEGATIDADSGAVILTAANPGKHTFNVSDVRIDYQGLKQTATLSLDSDSTYTERFDSNTDAGGRPVSVYFAGGKVYTTITPLHNLGAAGTPVTVSADLVPNQTTINVSFEFYGFDLYKTWAPDAYIVGDWSLDLQIGDTRHTYTDFTDYVNSRGKTIITKSPDDRNVPPNSAQVGDFLAWLTSLKDVASVGINESVAVGSKPKLEIVLDRGISGAIETFAGLTYNNSTGYQTTVYLNVPNEPPSLAVNVVTASGAGPTREALVAAINLEVACGGRLEGLIESAAIDAATGDILLTAAQYGRETFRVSDVRLDYQGINQIATVSFDTFADGTTPIAYFSGGKLSVEVTGVGSATPIIVSADMVAGDAAASISALVAAIDAAIGRPGLSGLISDVSVEGNVITLVSADKVSQQFTISAATASDAGKAEVSTVSFSTSPDDYFSVGSEEAASAGTVSVEVLGQTYSATMVDGDPKATAKALLAVLQHPTTGLNPNEVAVTLNIVTQDIGQPEILVSPGLLDLAKTQLTFDVHDDFAANLTQYGFFTAGPTEIAIVGAASYSFEPGDKEYTSLADWAADAQAFWRSATGDNGLTVVYDAGSGDIRLNAQSKQFDTLPGLTYGVVAIFQGTEVTDITFTFTGQVDDLDLEVAGTSSVDAVRQVTQIGFDPALLNDDTFIAGIGRTVSVTIGGVSFSLDGNSRQEILEDLRNQLLEAVDGDGTDDNTSLAAVLQSDGVGEVDTNDLTLTLTARYGGTDPLMVSELTRPEIDLNASTFYQQVELFFTNSYLNGRKEGEVLTLQMGKTTASYTVQSGDTQAAILTGLKTALEAQLLVGEVSLDAASRVITVTASSYGPNVLGTVSEDQLTNTVRLFTGTTEVGPGFSADELTAGTIEFVKESAQTIAAGTTLTVGTEPDVLPSTGVIVIAAKPLTEEALNSIVNPGDADGAGFSGDAARTDVNGILQELSNPSPTNLDLYGDNPLTGAIEGTNGSAAFNNQGLQQQFINPGDPGAVDFFGDASRTVGQVIVAQDDSSVIIGGAGNDVLLGTSELDVLLGEGGNDILDGRGGGDQLSGGAGDDVLVMGPEVALAFGGDPQMQFVGGDRDTFVVSFLSAETHGFIGDFQTGIDRIDVTDGPAGTAANFIAIDANGLTMEQDASILYGPALQDNPSLRYVLLYTDSGSVLSYFPTGRVADGFRILGLADVTGPNDFAYSDIVSTGLDVDDYLAAAANGPGLTSGVKQGYTNPDNGFAASPGSLGQDGVGGQTTGGDPSLYGSNPGYYTDAGLNTSYLTGGTPAGGPNPDGTSLYTGRGPDSFTDEVEVNATVNVGEAVGEDVDLSLDQGGDVDNATRDGFAAYTFDVLGSAITSLSPGNTNADTIWNFHAGADGDRILLEGELAASTIDVSNNGSVDVITGSNSRPALDLSTVEFGLIESVQSTLSTSQLNDGEAVADLLTGMFNFSTTTNGDLNTTIFAITASNDELVTALWAHRQSLVGDSTVNASELFHLATLNTIGGAFAAGNFGDFTTNSLNPLPV